MIQLKDNDVVYYYKFVYVSARLIFVRITIYVAAVMETIDIVVLHLNL